MKKSKKIVTLTLLSALLAVPFMMDNVNAKEENSATTTVKEDKISVIYIPKMHCNMCANMIKGKFQDENDINVTIDLENKKVTLSKPLTKKEISDILGDTWPYQLTPVVKEEQVNIDTIYVPSMHCGGCEKSIVGLFNSIGVKATADHTTKKVVLDKKVTKKQLDDLLVAWPYQLTPVVKEEQANIDTIYVPSMHCGGCENTIAELFNSIGVKATADHTTKKVVLDKKVTKKQLDDLLVAWPYQLTPVVNKEDNKNDNNNNDNINNSNKKDDENKEVDTIYIKKMMCKGCEKAIERLFNSIGVKATADHTTKKVVLDKKVSLKQLNTLLKDWPYSLEKVEAGREDKDENKEQKVDTIYIPSMMCKGCEKAIEKLFDSIGVKATADHTTKKVVLDKKLSLEQLDKLLLNPKLKKQWPYQLEAVEISKDEDKKEPQTDSTNGSLPKTSISSVSFITLVTSLTGAFFSKKRK